MMTRQFALLLLVLALGGLWALPAGAPAQDAGAPQLQPPETLPQDEDDEELGEEIPDEEGEEEGQETETPGGGGDPGPAPSQQQRSTPPAGPRASGLPRTGVDAFPMLIAGMLTLGAGLLAWAAAGPAPRRR